MTTRSMLAMTVMAAAMAPTMASADEFDFSGREVRTEVVSVADLDLSSGWGMDQLIKRLRSRIDYMCEGDEDCRDEAWLSADWQVARDLDRAQWRRRVAMERASDRRMYRVRMRQPGPGAGGPPPMAYAPPPAAMAGPPPGAVPVGKIVTTTDRTFTIRTTTVRVIYRLPSPEAGNWTPRCACGG